MDLAPYAMLDSASRGRRYPEEPHAFRTPFQRDRERIVHSSAFRRMTGKTQVLVATVNDHHRTRLTHTLEVTQVARTAARRLRLNEDLVEAIALAHDIGHPPFGHAGEDALDECLRDYGGFNHNLYGLRRVDELEERYPDFPGLNLTYEVREAFVRHAGLSSSDYPGGPLIEGELVDAVDSIAYDTHDLDDALGLGFISLGEASELALVRHAVDQVTAHHVDLPPLALRTAVIRELLASLVNGLLEGTTQRLAANHIDSRDKVRATTAVLVELPHAMTDAKKQLEQFLHTRVYAHSQVLAMKRGGQEIIRWLYQRYIQDPTLLPERHLRRWSGHALPPVPQLPFRTMEDSLPRVVGDYIAGMTDRFAAAECRRLGCGSCSN